MSATTPSSRSGEYPRDYRNQTNRPAADFPENQILCGGLWPSVHLFASSIAGISDCPLTVEPGAVFMWECNGSPQQQWNFTNDDLLRRANGSDTSSMLIIICLEEPSESMEDGVFVRISACDGGLNQAWDLVLDEFLVQLTHLDKGRPLRPS